MRGKPLTSFVCGFGLLLAGGVVALGVAAIPAVAATLHAPPPQQPRVARDPHTLARPGAHIRVERLVDTRTWTSDGGNTFPGADVPFGMVQWGPATRPANNAGGEYDRTDHRLRGYSLTHISGSGCGGGGDVPMLPTTGPLPAGDPNQITTAFSHWHEVAKAGYYSARSNAPNTVTSKFTATPHSSMARFTYPATTQADFLIKLLASQNGDTGDSVQVIGNNEVQGSDSSGNFCSDANYDGQPPTYTVYFDIVFRQPFTAAQVITNPGQTNPAAVNLTFNTSSHRTVEAKVGISYVSADDARLNWQTDSPSWDFAAVRDAAQTTWSQLLGRIQVGGGSHAQTQEFYSLLYKDFLHPNITSDVNGRFMGADFKVHRLARGQANQYGMFSGWDIYHSLSQLQAMLDPQAAGDMAQSQVNYYSEDGILQQWGYDNLNNSVMVGDPAQSIISDIYTFGAHNFHTKQALADMLAQATTVNYARPGELLERRYGYLPEDGAYGCCNPHGYASTLLEYDSQDLALAQFAKDLGDSRDAAWLTRRANNWENLFNPVNDLLNSRLANGQFEPGVTATFSGSFPGDPEPYVEGDPYEYLWDVPNDYAALFSLLGGNSKVAPLLEQYLSKPNGYGMYAQLSNEFDLGEQFALNYAGDPAGTQRAVANVRNRLYLPGPNGLPNNDDLGAESSQFIWEMLGMYPENSGHGTLVLTSPGFPRATIHLANGHAIDISAPGASPRTYYVRSLSLNGAAYAKLWVDYSELQRGAWLSWRLGRRRTSWGAAPSDAPPSYTSGLRPVVPFISEPSITIAPGTSTTVHVGAQNATAQRHSVRVRVGAPAGSGLTLAPASGTIKIRANGRRTLVVSISVAASTPPGVSDVTASVKTSGGAAQTVTVPVVVAQPSNPPAS